MVTRHLQIPPPLLIDRSTDRLSQLYLLHAATRRCVIYVNSTVLLAFLLRGVRNPATYSFGVVIFDVH